MFNLLLSYTLLVNTLYFPFVIKVSKKFNPLAIRSISHHALFLNSISPLKPYCIIFLTFKLVEFYLRSKTTMTTKVNFKPPSQLLCHHQYSGQLKLKILTFFYNNMYNNVLSHNILVYIIFHLLCLIVLIL